MYQIKFHPQVKKQAKKLHPKDQERFLKVAEQLRRAPYSKKLDIKKLASTQSGWRLRLGDFRVLFSVDKVKKIIYVWEVGYRGSIY